MYANFEFECVLVIQVIRRSSTDDFIMYCNNFYCMCALYYVRLSAMTRRIEAVAKESSKSTFGNFQLFGFPIG